MWRQWLFFWHSSRRQRQASASSLQPQDFVVLGQVERRASRRDGPRAARTQDALITAMGPEMTPDAVQESLAHLLAAGYIHRLSRVHPARYQLTQAGIALLGRMSSPSRPTAA
jgi:hypothetical protein